jgi:hypothetical protein
LDNYRPVPVSPATKVIEEKSLLPQAGINSGRTDDLAQELPNGMRLYAFTLSAGEKLKIEMKSERHGKVILRFILPTKPDAMTAQIRKANFSPVSVRSSRIEIQNTTDAPYETVLLVYGQCGYTFKLELDRQARK